MGGIGFPIYLSIKIAIVSTVVVIFGGFILSWVLARKQFPLKRLLEVAVNLPLVIPPTVLGYYLLLLFGRQGFMGYWLEKLFGLRFVFNWTGGVIAAVIAALPLFISVMRPILATLDPEIEQAAKVDGATTLQIIQKITLPLISKSLVAGTALAFARSLGEFGATIMLIGNIPGKTQTISIAIYQAVLSGDYGTANQLVLIMTFIAIFIMLLIGKIDYLK